jgi:hypothetical protein
MSKLAEVKEVKKDEPKPAKVFRFNSTKPKLKVMLKQMVSPAAVKNCPSLAKEVGPGRWAQFQNHVLTLTDPKDAEIIRQSHSFKAQIITEITE